MANERPTGNQQTDARDSSVSVQEPDEHLFDEQNRIERLNRIRQLVFGSLDGLLVPLGVVSAVAGGTNSAKAVIVAGIAEAFAGALSMGAGEFISGRSEAQVQQTEVRRELDEIRDEPDYELREMALLLEHEGVGAEDAAMIANTLARYPRAYHKTMVEKELGLQVDPRTVQIPEALTMGVSYIVGSVFPLIAYFVLPVAQALPVSIALTLVALVIVGLVKGKLASLNLMTSALEVVVVGGVSAGGGYLLGTVVPHIFGF
ncbi:MAG TPA: VIT1/CCC1 transporter family protein [Ktedonobacterales bacterium]|nr:VIT1/CCC1 transporter family protein [Ktedonobacterales bacterium]